MEKKEGRQRVVRIWTRVRTTTEDDHYEDSDEDMDSEGEGNHYEDSGEDMGNEGEDDHYEDSGEDMDEDNDYEDCGDNK